MIESVFFQNFKLLRRIECVLNPFTVIVGPNASGKTSLLNGIYSLSQLARKHTPDDIETVFHGHRWFDMVHSGDTDVPMILSCKTNGDELEFKASKSQSIERQPMGDSGWYAGVTGCSIGDNCSSNEPLRDRNKAALAIASLAFFHFEASELAKPSYSRHETPRVEYSGYGLATVIAQMKLSDEEDFDSLKAMISRIIPQLVNIRIVKRRISTYRKEVVTIRNQNITTKSPQIEMRDTLIFDFINRKGIPAEDLSEGTLLALGLLTVLHSPTRPRVILLDDIDKGLHPKAQKHLIEMLREILDKQRDLQIIATSHSPYFLDFLNFKEVRLMTTGDDGFSICGRLEEHPKFEKWKDELAPGEMWSLFGEKWMAEKESK